MRQFRCWCTKRSCPIEVDPRTWARFGFRHEDSESNKREPETVAEHDRLGDDRLAELTDSQIQ